MDTSVCALTSKPLPRAPAPAASRGSTCSARDRLLRRHSRSRLERRPLAELGSRHPTTRQSGPASGRSDRRRTTQCCRSQICDRMTGTSLSAAVRGRRTSSRASTRPLTRTRPRQGAIDRRPSTDPTADSRDIATANALRSAEGGFRCVAEGRGLDGPRSVCRLPRAVRPGVRCGIDRRDNGPQTPRGWLRPA